LLDPADFKLAPATGIFGQAQEYAVIPTPETGRHKNGPTVGWANGILK